MKDLADLKKEAERLEHRIEKRNKRLDKEGEIATGHEAGGASEAEDAEGVEGAAEAGENSDSFRWATDNPISKREIPESGRTRPKRTISAAERRAAAAENRAAAAEVTDSYWCGVWTVVGGG
mmetsp:Transcript_67788/g.187274  ORF Transcript_67788/g.187274 Transcript_67788/m.187274 type:complete len:122 (+) Transcript_67788:98-463(+)